MANDECNKKKNLVSERLLQQIKIALGFTGLIYFLISYFTN